nr:hypothetical protein [Tanacetum cinerariifolium]
MEILLILQELLKRNKADLEEQSLDDFFNSLKIYEAEVKHSSSTGTTTQNLAFVSSSNTDSTTKPVSAAASIFAVCAKMLVSSLPNVDSLSNMAMLTVRARRFLQRIGRNLGANGPTSLGFDMSKVECYNYHRKGHFVRECQDTDGSYREEVWREHRDQESSIDPLEAKRNKTDLEEQSLDDLFNNLKIYEDEVKSSSSTGTTTQNIAFVSSSNTDSTTELVSVAISVSAVCAKMPMSSLPNVDSLSNIDSDDLKEMDLKWQMTMSPKDSRRNDAAEPQRRNVLVETSTSNALVSQCDGVGSYDWSKIRLLLGLNYALMAFSSLSSSSDNEVVSCLKACSKAYAQLHSQYDKLTADFHKLQFDVIPYQTGLESVEARLLVYKQNEYVFEEDIKLLKLEVQLRDNALFTIRQKLKKAEQQRDDLKLKFQPSDWYHVVPPPYTGTFMPPKLDLDFNTAPTAVETDHSAFTVQLSPTKPDQDLFHTNRASAPIIKDWVFNSEDESETKASQIVSSFVQSTEKVKSPRLSIKHVETSIPADTPKPA